MYIDGQKYRENFLILRDTGLLTELFSTMSNETGWTRERMKSVAWGMFFYNEPLQYFKTIAGQTNVEQFCAMVKYIETSVKTTARPN